MKFYVLLFIMLFALNACNTDCVDCDEKTVLDTEKNCVDCEKNSIKCVDCGEITILDTGKIIFISPDNQIYNLEINWGASCSEIRCFEKNLSNHSVMIGTNNKTSKEIVIVDLMPQYEFLQIRGVTTFQNEIAYFGKNDTGWFPVIGSRTGNKRYDSVTMLIRDGPWNRKNKFYRDMFIADLNNAPFWVGIRNGTNIYVYNWTEQYSLENIPKLRGVDWSLPIFN